MNYHKVILIIGLPASGKSTYARNHINNSHTIFDDFITQFYNGKALKCIADGNNVCLIDPRLCIPSTYENILGQIKRYTNDIGIILFENNPQKSIKYSKIRNDKNKDNDTLVKTINAYSQKYSYDNYSQFDKIIIHDFGR